MAASPDLIARLDELIDLFNRRSLDLPDGLFTRQSQFVLNGIPFEARLGRSAMDPLVLMLARGAAGYRFVAKALQHAVPDATLQRGNFERREETAQVVVTGQCWLAGHLRGSGEPAEILCDITVQFAGSCVRQMTADVDEQALVRLQQARLIPG